MYRSNLLITALTGLFIFGTNASAQDTILSDRLEKEKQKRAAKISTFVQSSSSGLTTRGMEFNVGSDGSSISANFMSDRDQHKLGLFRTQYYNLKLTAPINKSTKSGNFLTNTGLANDFAAEFTLSGMRSRYATEEEAQREVLDLATIILEIFDTCVKDNNGDNSKCEGEPHKSDKYKPLFAQLLEENKPLTIINAPVWYYGISASAGYEKHEFRDPMDLSKLNQEKVSYAISPFVGLTPNVSDLYLGLGVKHSVQYEDVDEKTKCGVADEDGFQECLSAAFMAPEKKTESSVFGLVRHRFGAGDSNFPFAFEIKAAFDFEEDIFEVSAPLYLFSGDKDNLRGGIRLDWNDKDNDVTAGIFVGSSFDLFRVN